ncbi:hypothetical protein Tco_0233002 [Tanacetum coccineum]
MIVEDISSIIDPRLSQVVLGKPFIEVSNMTHDLSSGVVRFTNEPEGIVYNMPHKIEQYMLDLEKEHTKSVYFRNEEDKRRGVDYVMSKILGFYKDCLELGPEYLTGLEDEGGVTFETIGIHGSIYLMKSWGRTLGWHLEEIHVTWTHLEKKQTRLQLYTKSFKETVHTERGDDVAITKRRRQDIHINDVTDLATASEHSRLNVDLESSAWRRQFEPHVIAKRAKKSTRNHNPLALVAHSNVHNSQSHGTPSYSHSPQPYYVTHLTSVIYHEEDYQGEIQGDAQEDKLTTAMVLLARAITQHYSTPTNNRLHTLSNTRNQAVIQDGRVDVQSKNVGYARNMEANDQNIERASRTESNLRKPNVQCYNCDAIEEENDFMLDNYYGDESLKELNAVVIMMARIQPTDGATSSRSDADIPSENYAKLKTVINTYDDDQIDSSIIFDDPYVEDNGGENEHDSITYDQYVALRSQMDNVQNKAQNKRSMNNELKKQQALLQKELETFKKQVKTLEKQPVKALNYKDAYEE